MDIDEDDLRDAIMDDEEAKELSLDNLTFVISGEFELISRPRLEALIKE